MTRKNISGLIAVFFCLPVLAQHESIMDVPPNMYALGNFMVVGGQTIPVDSHRYVYNTNGLILSDTQYVYQFPSGSYPKSKIFTYSYDSVGRLSSMVYDNWDQNTNTVKRWSRRMLIYNSSGLLYTDTWVYWNNSNSVYESGNRIVNTYDSSGKLITSLHQDYQLSYVTQSKDEYTYYPNGKINSVKNTDLFANGDYRLNVYGYNGSDRFISDSGFVYDHTSQQTYLQTLYSQSYDNAGRLLSMRNRSYQATTGVLNSDLIDTVFYNPNGTRQKMIRYEWNGQGAFLPTSTMTYEYNSSFTLITKSNSESGTRYYYQNSILGLTKLSERSVLKMYPNPTSDWFTIDMPRNEPCEVKVYSVTGENVFSIRLSNSSQPIDVSSLKRGSYIVEVTTLSVTYHSRLLKH